MVKFSKVLVLSLLVVGLCAPLALATTSRVQALAGASSYINDDSDVFRWYGTLPSYSKMVMAEAGMFSYNGVAGDVNYQALGFTHDWGEDHWLGTWGVFLLRGSIEDPSLYAFNPLPTPGMGPVLGADYPIPSTKFALSWGKDVGKIALGLMFTRSEAMFKLADDPEVNYTFTTIGGGIRWDANEDLYGDAALTIGSAGGKPDGGWDKTMGLNLEGRLFWEVLEDATVVPFARYRTADYALETAVAPSGDSWSEWTVGASLDFDVNTNNLLIFAADVQGFDWKYSLSDGDKTEFSQFVFPRLYVALESDITSWFTFRVGATKTMVKTTYTDADGLEYEFTFPVAITEEDAIQLEDFTWHMGGGFHIGEWDVDAVFSHELPFRLGYWLTGFGSDNPEPVVGRVSATYRF